MPVIPATLEVDAGGSQSQACSWQKQDPTRKIEQKRGREHGSSGKALA
jgi:hypothetical protein